jgi:tRNA(Leu) C34 or U34 (ribose-2'-O)-methylase TrmL
MAKRWAKRPEGSNWGEFGDDDQLGSLNYITPDSVLRAAKEIREGKSFCLSLPLDYPGGSLLTPARFLYTLKPTERDGNPIFNTRAKGAAHFFCDVVCDDSVLMCTQYSTQWDSFAHVGSVFDLDGKGEDIACFYNGYRAGIDVIPPSQRPDNYAMKLGIDAFAVKAIVTTARHSPEATGVLAKSASGALELVPMVTVQNLARALNELNEAGFLTVGLDSEGTEDLAVIPLRQPLALVLGAEGKGLRQLTRETCNAVARLDMPGDIKSLNVSNAAVLALYVGASRLGLMR